MVTDVRISVWNAAGSACLVRDAAATDCIGGYVRYTDTPAGCGPGEIGLGLYYEDPFTRGYWTDFNIVEVSTGDDKLKTAISSGATKLYVTDTRPYDTAQGEDAQQVYLYDGVTLTMGIPVTGVGTDGGGAFLTVGAPRSMPGNPGTIPAYGAGAVLGRRRYAGVVMRRDRTNTFSPGGTVTLGPLSSAFDQAFSGYTIGALANYDVTTACYTLLSQFASQWPHLTISAGNFAAMTGATFSGNRQDASAGNMVADAFGALSNGFTTALTAGTTAGAGTVLNVTAGTGTNTAAGTTVAIGSGATAEFCSVTASAANTITVAATTQNHAIGDPVTVIASDTWAVRLGHDRAPRMIKLYASGTNTYTYSVSLQQGYTTFEPLAIAVTDQDASQYYNRIKVNGGTNPATQQPYSAIATDDAAIALLGRVVDGAPVTVTSLNSTAACVAYAQGLLNQYSIGRSTGRFRVRVRNDVVVAEQAPQGLTNGDCVRAVQNVIVKGFGDPRATNIVTDSEVALGSASLGALWTVASGTVTTYTSGLFGSSGGFQVPASGTSSSAAIDSSLFAVIPGETLFVAGNVAASTSSGTAPRVRLLDPSGAAIGTVTATNGASGTYGASIQIPANYAFTKAKLRFTANGTTPGAAPINFAQPLVRRDGGTAYVISQTPPNVYGLPSTVQTTIDFRTGDRYQDVVFSAIEPDFMAAVAEHVNASATALHGNTGTGSSAGQYIVSAAAFPPTFSTGSLVVGTPAFQGLFALGSTPISFAANASAFTLPASDTTWVSISSSGTWTLRTDPGDVAGAIKYGYFTTSATGVLGFTQLASIGLLGIPAAYMLGGVTYTPALNGAVTSLTTTGLQQFVTQMRVKLEVLNQPTDGSFVKMIAYYRISGANTWLQFATSPPRDNTSVTAGNGTQLTNGATSATGDYAFLFPDASKGVTYEFGFGMESAQRTETAIVSLGTLLAPNTSVGSLTINSPSASVKTYTATNTLDIDATLPYTISGTTATDWIDHVEVLAYSNYPGTPGKLSLLKVQSDAKALTGTMTASLLNVIKNYAGSSPSYSYGFEVRVVAVDGTYIAQDWVCSETGTGVTTNAYATQPTVAASSVVFSGSQTVQSLATSSTAMNAQGSIIPFVTDINLTLSAPAGQTKITASTNSGGFYRADGSVVTVASATHDFTGLATSGHTYYVAAYAAATSGTTSTMSFTLYDGVPTISQQQSLLQDGFVVLISPAVAPTPGGGGSGGGTGKRYL